MYNQSITELGLLLLLDDHHLKHPPADKTEQPNFIASHLNPTHPPTHPHTHTHTNTDIKLNKKKKEMFPTRDYFLIQNAL